MKKSLYIILFLFIMGAVSAQNPEQKRINSLRLELSKTKEDTVRVNRLSSLSREYYINNSRDTAFSYAQQALALAGKLNFKKGKATALRYMGNHYSDSGNIDKALAFYHNALSIARQTGDKQEVSDCLRDIGQLYDGLSDFSNAVIYLQEAIQIAKETQNLALTINIYRTLGYVFFQLNNYPETLKNYQQALDISEKLHDKQNTAIILQNFGWFYRDIGDYKKGLDFLNKALNINKEIGNEQWVAICITEKGIVYMWAGDYKESLAQFNQAVEIFKKTNNETDLIYAYANMAYLYQILSDYATAIKYHKSSFSIAQKFQDKFGELLYYKDMGALMLNAPDSILLSIDVHPSRRYQTAIDYENRALKMAIDFNNPTQKIAVLDCLITAYEKQGDFKSAFYGLQHYSTLNDSIRGQSAREEIVRKEMQYEFEKKEAVTKAERQKEKEKMRLRYSIVILVIFIIALTGFLLLYFAQMKKKKEKQIYLANQQIIELEKEKVEAELIQARKDVEQFLSKINEKNQLIDKVAAELKQLQETYDDKKSELTKTLTELRHTPILTDEDWARFLSGFDRLYPEFTIKIKAIQPKTTTSELRFLMLSKIGLSTQRMAATLGVSPNSVRVTWKRVKDKLNASAEDTPQSLLNKIENMPDKAM